MTRLFLTETGGSGEGREFESAGRPGVRMGGGVNDIALVAESLWGLTSGAIVRWGRGLRYGRPVERIPQWLVCHWGDLPE